MFTRLLKQAALVDKVWNGSGSTSLGTIVDQGTGNLTYFQVFHSTPLSFALVNLKPLLPGHVLVSPRRPVG